MEKNLLKRQERNGKMIKPKRLKKGDKIAIVSLSWVWEIKT